MPARAGHRRHDVGEPDPSDADGDVQVRRSGGVLAEPRRVGRTGELVRPVIRVPVADAPDILVPEQPPERIRRVLLRTGVGGMEAMPVDAVAPRLALHPPRELRLAVVAGHPGQRQCRGDEEIDGVAVDDERAHRRGHVRVTARTTRCGMAGASVGPVMTAPERPRGLFDGGPSAASRRPGRRRAARVAGCGRHRRAHGAQP
jgi:hypothetical protein